MTINPNRNPPRSRRRVQSGSQGTNASSQASSSTPNYTPYQPAPPKVEILTQPLNAIRRPLALVNGQAYAVTFVDVKTIETEYQDANGIKKYNPPRESIKRHRVALRSDGVVFADFHDGRCLAMSDLGIDLELPELPPDKKLLSPAGLKKFMSGYRPDPIDVFNRLTQVFDTFIDFSHSLADQRTMCEFLANYVLSTWFLEAFDVIGYLWPNGERGSGKTNLLLLISELGYLGQFILAGGSYASLRDLADCGATLCFDDAENLADSKFFDPDKRALLLAGNRRGVTVPLKEPTTNKGWRTRYVNAYCPRSFSAIRLPDPVLSGRSIIVPLARTPDRKRANIDPTDYSVWPHDHQELIDDQWILALQNLPDLKKWDAWVGVKAELTGRNLQPWRAILAVAAWLDSLGGPDLFHRMQQLSISYQKERLNIETSDFTVLVIRAIFDCAESAISANPNQGNTFIITSENVSQKAGKIIDDDDLEISKDIVTSRSVGRAMGKLRIPEKPRSGGKGHRSRIVTLSDLSRLSQAYEIPLPDGLCVHQSPIVSDTHNDGINGMAGTDGSTDINQRPCYACKTSNWIKRLDGSDEYCGTCHPIHYKSEV